MQTTTLKKKPRWKPDAWKDYMKIRPKNENIERRCLGTCGKMFKAINRFNRLCDDCGKKDHS